MKKSFITLLCLILISFALISRASSSDEYLLGYIQSIFIHIYHLPYDSIAVKDGVVYIHEDKLGRYNPEQITEKVKQSTASLSSNIKAVILVKGNNVDGLKTEKGKRIKESIFSEKSEITKEFVTDGVMANHSLFQPLIADPKWPRFTLAYQYDLKKSRLKRHAFAPNFGASFSLYRIKDLEKDQEWELSIQAGLFGLMDIGRNPTALMNADYFVGFPISYRRGALTALLRPYHISTHLGDEFMLTPEGKAIKRINLSYEGIDLILSHNIKAFRVYGGGGYLVHKEPSYIKPLKLQIGAEYYATNTFMDGRLRPVSGIDVKAEENGSWLPGVSIKTGVQIENSALVSNKLQIMLEYYSGRSMHGQFYKDKIQYIGIALHAFL
jgi:hypothetical protein